ncbi:hypothetical protein V5R04_06890 [Jonesiaceae bacterium BS-20]|uniref:Uncharacterized protein n=1 Tax=Jonesiaceae bacterium BS-20 TaxID=3120821 RepID=A0AAU7E0U9_9MICO
MVGAIIGRDQVDALPAEFIGFETLTGDIVTVTARQAFPAAVTKDIQAHAAAALQDVTDGQLAFLELQRMAVDVTGLTGRTVTFVAQAPGTGEPTWFVAAPQETVTVDLVPGRSKQDALGELHKTIAFQENPDVFEVITIS